MTTRPNDTPLLRLHDWLVRHRLIRGQQWGQANLAKRLFRIRFHSAVILALPPLLLCAWYSLGAWAAHLAHEAEIGAHETFTWRLFQLHLHDKLTRDLHRLMAPEPQHKSTLPTYGLIIGNDELDQLASRLPPDDGQPYYVDAQLVKGNRAFSVQVRYRGGKYWHYNHPQKSWKVRIKDGKLIEGFNTFSFINTPESVPFEEEIILGVAREIGLLTPEYFPFRLLVNKAYTGVHFFESQPDEGMLRHAQRPTGAIYSGSESPVDPATGVSSLFKSADNFNKVTQGIHQKLGERSELESLIAAINDASPLDFARYADEHLDVQRFAQWDALDVVFGCNQHDFSENHKLYFDPYRDRFEPIAWNYRGCKHESELNRTENPLLLRLKQLPRYLTVRNRIVYDLLRGIASVSSLRSQTGRLLDRLREDQARDPYWDAFQLLPGVSPYYSLLLRPADRRAQDIAVETRLFEMQERENYLTELLERRQCAVELAAPSAVIPPAKGQPTPTVSTLDITVSGHAGYSLAEVEPTWQPGCSASSWHLYADTDLDGRLRADRDRRLASADDSRTIDSLDVELYPGSVMQKRTPQVHRGNVRIVPASRTYRFFVESFGCSPLSARVRLTNLLTRATERVTAEAGGLTRAIPKTEASCTEKFSVEPGYESPHTWCYPHPSAELISIGPGVIDVERSRTYSRVEPVEIAPGTTLRLAKGASLIFMGSVKARGTEAAPIRIEGKQGVWGGLAIQGDGTRGSVLEHVEIQGGTKPESAAFHWPGVVNIGDTSDIHLKRCIIDATASSAGLHIGESKSVVVERSTIRGGGPSVEIQFSGATLDGLGIIGSASDAIALGASQAEIRSTKILSFENDGISANRRSDVSLEDVLVARGNRGIRVHEASQLKFDRVLLYENRECLSFDASNDGYSRKGHIGGSALFEVSCQDSAQNKARYGKIVGLITSRPASTDLPKLRMEVLGIPEWTQLGQKLDSLSKGGVL